MRKGSVVEVAPGCDKERKRTVECGWCNSDVVFETDGTCPRCGAENAVTPPWMS